MWDKLWEAIQKYGGSARDARIGAVGVDQVRDLYKSDKQEDKELAKELNDRYLSANAAGIAGGATAASALTAGVVPTLVSEVGGAVGSYAAGEAGSYLDEQFGTQWISPTLSVLGGLGGGFAGYKTLKPSYNYLAKNGVIGYKDVPEEMIALPKGNIADNDRYVILRDMLSKEFKDSNKAVHVSPNPILIPNNVNKAAAHAAGTKYVPGNSNVSIVTQNGDNKVWFWEGDLYRNRPMTDKTIIQILKSYAKGNTRQAGATYVDDVDLTDSNVKIFQYDPVAKTYGRTIVTNQPSIIRGGKTSYKFYERPSKLSPAEKAGIPKGERKYLQNWDNWSLGGPISEKHLIEYAQIDNDLFRNKYKHPDWIDRRSIIQLNSKDAEKLNKTILYTGHEGKVDPKFDRILWTTKGPFSARLYADSDDNVLQIVIPKAAKIKTTDANKSSWAQLNNVPGRKTNHFVAEAFHDGYDIAKIKNVIDVGPNYVPKDSKFYIDFPDFPVQDDVVIKRGFPRKSIIGNNGDFNLSDPDLFKKQGGKLNNKLTK